jgi:hypothetical protein
VGRSCRDCRLQANGKNENSKTLKGRQGCCRVAGFGNRVCRRKAREGSTLTARWKGREGRVDWWARVWQNLGLSAAGTGSFAYGAASRFSSKSGARLPNHRPIVWPDTPAVAGSSSDVHCREIACTALHSVRVQAVIAPDVSGSIVPLLGLGSFAMWPSARMPFDKGQRHDRTEKTFGISCLSRMRPLHRPCRCCMAPSL